MAGCFNCMDSCSSASDNKLLNGWRVNTGEFAQLCITCCSVYKGGQFCETFHSDEDGWRDCELCKKLIHCGCIVSLSDYTLHDSGGITCTDCSNLAQQNSNAESHPTDVTDLANEKASNIVLTPLFEKMVSISDSKLRASRLVIPLKYAKAYFPEVPDVHQPVILNILDTDGKEWAVYYRCWSNRHKIKPVNKTKRVSKTKRVGKIRYVLTGLKEFIVSKNMQGGDTVAFFRGEPGGKIVVEVRK